MDQFRLDGKVALVSGGSRGLGAAIVQGLAAAGAKVVITDVLVDEGEKLAATIGTNTFFARLDVTREADWEAAIDATVERFGGFDVLVNNAGIDSAGLFANFELENFERLMRINVGGVFLGMKHGFRAMRPGGAAGRGGSIVNMSSAGAIKPGIGLGPYCGSKAAVLMMTKAAAIEGGRDRIRVNSVHPGLVKTDMGINTFKDYVRLGLVRDEETAEKIFLKKHPLGFGEPQDIANGVRYLASDAARWVTGLELSIDGGLTAG